MDRFKVRDDIQQRLAESFETALKLADGVAKVVAMDAPDDVTLFSARFACSQCGYSIAELEPRMFSFNNPAGACPTCDGLGMKQFVDPARVVAHPELSMAAGAIRGWDRRNAYYYQMLQSLAAHYQFDLETPFDDLPENVREVILYGSGRSEIDFSYFSDRGKRVTRKHVFEGIVPNLQRRYHETESGSVRDELAKFHSVRACPECHGARLTESARHVFIQQVNLPEVTSLPIGEAKRFF